MVRFTAMGERAAPPASYPLLVGAAMFTPGVIFVLVFNAVLLANLDEVGYEPALTVVFVTSFLMAAAICVAVFRRAGGSLAWELLGRAIILLGVAVFALEVLRPLTGPPDLRIRWVLLIELGTVLVVTAIVLKASFRTLLLVLSVVAPIQVVSAAYQQFAAINTYASPREFVSPLSPVGLTRESRPSFSWPAIGSASHYEIEVVDSATGNQVVQERVAGNRYRPLSDLVSGHAYRWRFRELTGGEPGRHRGWVPLQVVSDDPQSSAGRADPLLQVGRSQSSPNVYLVVFDAYQSQMYEYLRDERTDIPELPMTFFPEFRSNSAKTWSSMTELLGGAHYSPQDRLSEWRRDSTDRGVFSQLYHNGIQIHEYPYYGYHCYEFAAACDVTVEAKKKDSDRGSTVSTIVDLWFLNLLPTTVRRIVSGGTVASVGATDWDYGFSLSERLFGTSDRPSITDNAYFAVKQFERMLEDEQHRPPQGQVVFIHLILPHTPYVVDGDCEYQGDYGTDDIDQPGFFEHSTCALRLLASLLERLEELGRLESSLVIAMSDHGKVWHPALLGRLSAYTDLDATSPWMNADLADSSSWSSEIVETRSSALLLVKHPGQGDGGDSSAPTQVIDIAPTIAAHFGLSTKNYAGQSLGEIDSGVERERLFYAFNKFPRGGAPALMSVYRNTGGSDWMYSHDIETTQ
jgi:hypothetical protein